MLRWKHNRFLDEVGDTLIEVTFALGIMATVLVSATAVSVQAFQLGLAARERTQLVHAAIEQAEALRSFRDNNTWPTAYHAVQAATSIGCNSNFPAPVGGTSKCFAMTNATSSWAPTASLTAPGTPAASISALPPGSVIEIFNATPASAYPCAMKLMVYYGSPTIGNANWQVGEITVELVNQQYSGGYAACHV